MKNRVFDFIKNDNTVLEQEPLEKVAKTGHLKAYLHKGFYSVWIQKEIWIYSMIYGKKEILLGQETN